MLIVTSFGTAPLKTPASRIRDIRLGMATMVLQEGSVQGPKWLLSTLKGVNVVEETVFQV